MDFEPLMSSMHGLTTNQEIFDELIGNLDKRLDVYDQILSKQKFVAGEVRFSFLPLTVFTYVQLQEVTLADLFHIPYGSFLPAAGSNILDTKPNVARCVDFFSNKISDFDVRRLNKMVEGHHVPPFLDRRQGWCQVYRLGGRIPRITQCNVRLRVIDSLGAHS